MAVDFMMLPINLLELAGRTRASVVTVARAKLIDLWTELEYRMIRVGLLTVRSLNIFNP
jgi:hypothetical protein